MRNCPRCRFASFDGATACVRCDLAFFAAPAMLAVPMPDPMTEPVFAPVIHETDNEALPLNPALAQPFAELDVEVDADAIPPADSPRWAVPSDPHGTHVPSDDVLALYVVSGTLLSQEPPGTPMNESAVQAANATIPATDRADQAPTPAPPTIRPKFIVLRGMKIGTEYPVYEGRNTVGRFADKPVDIDLVCQESTEQIWCSRQHAVVVFEKGNVLIEDLNSLNGTWVNGVRIHAGQPRQLRAGDVVQIGTVQLKLILG